MVAAGSDSGEVALEKDVPRSNDAVVEKMDPNPKQEEGSKEYEERVSEKMDPNPNPKQQEDYEEGVSEKMDPDSKQQEEDANGSGSVIEKMGPKQEEEDANGSGSVTEKIDPKEAEEEEEEEEEGKITSSGRRLTMRELLTGSKTDSEQLTNTPLSENGSRQSFHNNAAMELINSVTGLDDEARSRQRILTYAAKRYANAIERNSGDYDALYNWALVLQESADNVDLESASPSKDALLEEACKKYEEATRLCPSLHDAFYNWAIAISDRARMRGRTKEAEELWKQATEHYEKAVELNWNSPQALNNWGLALQELSAIVPAKEKHNIVKMAISKFRSAIQLQFDFHRAIYNLGTVLYGLAEDLLRIGGSGSSKDVSPNELYSQCAIYIAAAHALKPNYPVYRSALRLVRSMLPLPYLKVGYLTAPPAGNPIAPHSDWKRTQFVLNHEGLYQLVESEQKPSRQSLSSKPTDAANNKRSAVKVDIPDIVSVSACADLTLPPGAGLCIDTIDGPFYLVADSWESLDGWLDAIRLVYTIFARGKSDVLAGVITG